MIIHLYTQLIVDNTFKPLSLIFFSPLCVIKNKIAQLLIIGFNNHAL